MDEFILDDKYKTGISEIDQQHKKLINQIESLTLALYKGSGSKKLVEICNFLNDYIEEHFKTEEDLMLKIKYHDFRKHMTLHSNFKEMYYDLQNQISKRGSDNYLAIEVENKLYNWWKQHIIIEDMKYAQFMKNTNEL